MMKTWEVATPYMVRNIQADYIVHGDEHVEFYHKLDPNDEAVWPKRTLIAQVSGDFVIRQIKEAP